MLRLAVLSAIAALAFAIPAPRIIGGSITSIEDVPYTACILRDGKSACAGAIISTKFILTAAQCVHGDPSDIMVRVGSSGTESGGELHSIKNVYEHENQDNIDNDIAILELKEAVQLSNRVQVIEIARNNEEVASGSTGVVSGWGYEKEPDLGGKPSELIKSVEVPIPSKLTCKAVYPDIYTDKLICAGGPIGGTGPCDGDWGAPLAVNGKLVGIASWSEGCGRPNKPAIFQDVARFTDFIGSHVQN